MEREGTIAVRSALRLLAAAVGGYVLGTTPSAAAAARVVSGGAVDPRSTGTGNPGAFNAGRVLGRRVGRIVAGADIAKGAAACVLGRRCAGDVGAHVAGVASVVGHCYPVWSGFRGGKGVATSYGQCLYTLPAYAPVDAAVAVAVARAPGVPRPALAAVTAASTLWIGAGALWWRRALPNLWGPRPTAALPLANLATVLVLVSRGIAMVRAREPDELVLPR